METYRDKNLLSKLGIYTINIFNMLLLLFSHSVMSNSLRPHGLQHSRLSCPSPSPRACWNSSPLSPWCHPIISYCIIPFSFGRLPLPASRSFPMSSSSHQLAKVLKLHLQHQLMYIPHLINISQVIIKCIFPKGGIISGINLEIFLL